MTTTKTPTSTEGYFSCFTCKHHLNGKYSMSICKDCRCFSKYEELAPAASASATPPASAENPAALSKSAARKLRRKPFLVDFVDKKIAIVLQAKEGVSLNKRRHFGTIVPESLTFKPGFLTLLQASDKDTGDRSQTYRSFPLEAIVEVALEGRLFIGEQSLNTYAQAKGRA